jgi:hypothetical protein
VSAEDLAELDDVDAASEEPLRPTLGPQVVAWQQAKLVHGPGDVRGHPYRPTLEHQALIYTAYEVHPQGHPKAGRRVYQDVAYSRAKGTAKTEMAGGLGAVELGPDGEAPARCDGFDAHGQPVGRPVRDPDIPFLATTLEQAADLAYTRARSMMTEGPLAEFVDDGELELYGRNGGKLYVVSSRAASKDGYIPTFAHADETHLFTTAEARELVRTVWFNLDKRRDADPWALQTSTAFAPGERSVLEGTFELARQIAAGEFHHPGFLLDHLEASDEHDLDTDEGLRAAILEASGLAAEFRDVDRIVQRFRDPRVDVVKARRYWLNQIVKSAGAFLHPDDVAAGTRRGERVRRREAIALGFDGSRYDDTTALVGCRLSDGFLFVVAVWERPDDAPRDWGIPSADVDRTVRRTFRDYDVARFYADPPGWQDYIDRWAADLGDKRVVKRDTRLERRMAADVERLATAFAQREQLHDGHEALIRHFENARRRAIGTALERADPLGPFVLEKARKDLKIDLAVAAVLAKTAAAHAIADGALNRPRRRSGGLTFH